MRAYYLLRYNFSEILTYVYYSSILSSTPARQATSSPGFSDRKYCCFGSFGVKLCGIMATTASIDFTGMISIFSISPCVHDQNV